MKIAFCKLFLYFYIDIVALWEYYKVKSCKTRLRGGDKMRIAECNEPMASNVQRIIEEKGLKQVAVAKRAGYSKELLKNNF
jgi:hypothetical protein